MRAPGEEVVQRRGSCGVQGCMYAAIALFALMLVGVLILAAIRFSSPPEPRMGPQQPPPTIGSLGPEFGLPIDVTIALIALEAPISVDA